MPVDTSPASALQERHEAEQRAIEALEVAVADFLDAVLAEARSAVDAMAQRSQLRASGPVITFARQRNPFAYTNIREHWYSTVRELANRREDIVTEEVEQVLLDSMLPAQVYEDVTEVLARARSNDWTTYQTKRHLSALLIPKSPREHEKYKARVRFLGRTTATMNSSLKRLREFREDSSVVGKRWVAHHDERTRSSHLAANGQTVAIDDPFIVGGAALAFPGDPSAPMEEVANCFVPETTVSGTIDGAYRRYYSGDVIEVRPAGGRPLTGTPKHPVLTDRGWVALEDLVEGDHLVRYRRGVHAPVSRYIEGRPAPAREVYDALAVAFKPVRVSGGRVDFHGEPVEGDVDVVRPQGQLRHGGQTTADEFVRQLLLSATDEATAELVGASTLGADGLGVDLPSSSGVRSGDVPGVLLGSPLRDGEPVRFRLASQRDAVAGEEAEQRGSADPKALCQAVLGLTGYVTFDDVLGVRRIPYSGHVYNLSTGTGAYTANGIVAHNCRCSMVPAIKGDTGLAALLTSLLAAAQAETLAYNPRQLRVPKGNGPLSGRWVDGPLRILADLIDSTAESRKARSPNLRPASDADKTALKDKHGVSIPPALTDVHVDLSDDADLIATGLDAKGRKKYIYSSAYEDAQAAAKWARQGQVAQNAGKIFDWTENIDGDPMKAAVRLMATEGIRVGSSDKQRGDVMAYGATTLRAGHASVDKDGNVALDFTAKEGIEAHYDIDDPQTADYIKKRLAEAGPDERLFPGVDADNSIEAIREVTGLPSIKNHDLRTLLANLIARAELDARVPPPPANAKEAQRIRKEIATVVSEHLHNKPAQALASYINPATLAPLLDIGGSS